MVRTGIPNLETAPGEELRAFFAAVRQPIGTSETLPPACYTDEGLFRREQRDIFRRCWIGIGRADRWKRDGDFSALDIAGVPVVVLRDRKGVLRAYANTCRHRGAQLLRGEGRRQMITCPFHGWGYGLDGCLRNAPTMEQTPGFKSEEYGLIAFRAEVRDGFAFVCLNEDAPSLDEWLGDFSDVHGAWGLGEMVSTRRREFEVACNWKSFLEVFNEYYHLPYVHPKSIGGIYQTPDDPDHTSGHYTSQFGLTKGTGGLVEDNQANALPDNPRLRGRNRQGTRYSWIFPNMTFAAGSDMVWVYDVFPLAPGRTQVGMTACFPVKTSEHPDFDARVAHYYERLDQAIAEDIPLLERQQSGLASPFAKPGRFSHLEPSVANFACWYAGQMTGT